MKVSLFSMDLVARDFHRLMGYENINKGKRVIILYFHSILDVGRCKNAINMFKEIVQHGKYLRPNNQHIINKLKPTFWL